MSRAVTVAMAVLFCVPLQAAIMLAPDRDGYQMIDSNERFGPVYGYVDIHKPGTLTRLNLTDDGSAEIRLPFRFEFYGVEYSTAQVSANGYISFGASDNNLNSDRLAIPQPAGTPDWQSGPFIAPWFDDLDPEANGTVYYYLTPADQAPNRRAVVQWSAAHHDDHSAIFEFQLVLEQTSNRILFQYRKAEVANGAITKGASASVGIQGRDTPGRAAGINYAGPLTNNLAIGFVPVKYGYIGIPDPEQEGSGAPGATVNYMVEVVNGKDVATDFKVELLPGSRWRVVDLPSSTGLIPPGEAATLAIKVRVPTAGSDAMGGDILSLKITDKVEETTSGGSGGGSTNTQNNEQTSGATSTTTTKEIMSFVNLKTSCLPAPCFQQDSDGDGVADGSEAASSVNDAAKVHGLAALSGKTITVEVGTTREEKLPEPAKPREIFDTCTPDVCAINGFSVEEVVDGPERLEFAEGVIDYRIIPARLAESLTLKITPSTPWSEKMVLYTVDSDGKFTVVDDKKWKPQGDGSSSYSVITLTLVDGGNFDADGVSNGVIVNRLAMGEPALQGGGTGAGASGALSGELLLLMLLGGWRYAAWRGQQGRGLSRALTARRHQ